MDCSDWPFTPKIYEEKEHFIMRQQSVFQGAATALVTPTNANGIDFAAFKKLINWQIDEGINALVICGTTGEGSTLSDAEHREALQCAVETTAGRVPIIAGTGSNDTANAIADASTKPLIIYNVPSRTGVGIEPATYVELAKHPMIAGIKEANGNISKIVETAALVGDQLDIYSGNDDEIVPIMSCGGKGVISVLSNVAPKATVELCNRCFRGDYAGAMDLQAKYLPLIRSLFCEVNPIPVKAAMAAMGFCENYVRLPLTTMEEAHYNTMLQRMRDVGISV